MSKHRIVLIGSDGRAERKILSLRFVTKPQPHLGSCSTDVYIPLTLTRHYWEEQDGKRTLRSKKYEAHAAYHSSGEVHLKLDGNGFTPPELTQQGEPPNRLSSETDLYGKGLIVLHDLDPSEGKVNRKKGDIVLTLDIRKFQYETNGGIMTPFFGTAVSLLPVVSDDTETEVIEGNDSITFIVKRVEPWCKIVVKAQRW